MVQVVKSARGLPRRGYNYKGVIMEVYFKKNHFMAKNKNKTKNTCGSWKVPPNSCVVGRLGKICSFYSSFPFL
ncbi:hypothetical protein FKM82_030551 [Ascaphus truei]